MQLAVCSTIAWNGKSKGNPLNVDLIWKNESLLAHTAQHQKVKSCDNNSCICLPVCAHCTCTTSTTIFHHEMGNWRARERERERGEERGERTNERNKQTNSEKKYGNNNERSSLENANSTTIASATRGAHKHRKKGGQWKTNVFMRRWKKRVIWIFVHVCDVPFFSLAVASTNERLYFKPRRLRWRRRKQPTQTECSASQINAARSRKMDMARKILLFIMFYIVVDSLSGAHSSMFSCLFLFHFFGLFVSLSEKFTFNLVWS